MKSTILLALMATIILSGCITKNEFSNRYDPDNINIVGALAREMDDSTLSRDLNQCEKWTYSEEIFAADFHKMHEVESGDWGRLCYSYSCSYVGNANYQERSYEVKVNAGGWVILSSSENKPSRFFISSEKNSSFIDSCDCCE